MAVGWCLVPHRLDPMFVQFEEFRGYLFLFFRKSGYPAAG